jgi:hypothetical protein
MATAGIILGWVAIALSILGIVIFAVIASTNPDWMDTYDYSSY